MTSRNKLCNSIKLIDINCRSRRIVIEIPPERSTKASHNTEPWQDSNNSGTSVCCVFCVVSGRARSHSFLCQHREMSGWSHNLAPKQRAPLLKGQGAPALLKQGQLVAGNRPGTQKKKGKNGMFERNNPCLMSKHSWLWLLDRQEKYLFIPL